MALDQVEAAERAARPPVYWDYDIAGATVERIPDQTPRLWRKFGVGVCDYAITHGLTREQLTANLILLGVIEDPAPGFARDPLGNRQPPRRSCPACRRTQAVALDDRLYKHPNRDGDGDCDGSYATPEAVAP